jgi:hypothetical protein
MTWLEILVSSHPFIAIIFILTVAIISLAGIVCTVSKDAEQFAEVISTIVFLWLFIGLGYLMVTIIQLGV